MKLKGGKSTQTWDCEGEIGISKYANGFILVKRRSQFATNPNENNRTSNRTLYSCPQSVTSPISDLTPSSNHTCLAPSVTEKMRFPREVGVGLRRGEAMNCGPRDPVWQYPLDCQSRIASRPLSHQTFRSQTLRR